MNNIRIRGSRLYLLCSLFLNDLDSVAVALVSSNDTILEVFHGPLRANETDGPQIDRNSIYRIASISKLFTALETFILREKGALNLDDSVGKYISQLQPLLARDQAPVTFRQLMSHMSGLGRDWPPSNAADWPETPYGHRQMPGAELFLDALNSNTAITDSYSYPIYSNTGYNLLGYANVFANENYERANKIFKTGIPTTHAELMERDVFRRLGLNGSSFLITDGNKKHAVVSSAAPEETDVDFEATNPAGGQVSSLSDLVKLSQSLLNPSAEGALLPPKVMNEWLRTLHTYWDCHTSIGMLWEIYRTRDSFQQSVDVFQKLGDLGSHHTAFSLIPARSFGIVALTSGDGSHAYNITNLAIRHFLPAFDEILAARTQEEIGGRWTNSDGAIELVMQVQKGSLYATRYYINGTDALASLQGDPVQKMAVWYTGNDEYRFAPMRGLGDYGCFGQWVGLDGFAYRNNVSVNLLRLAKDGPTASNNILRIPSMKIDLKRR
ncbi:beta-lactamase/transpeptidase-like protein [Ramaria rubella]|nr:beta-lactamase/transpeptidase-like protein [Ramaria rubella]